MQAGTLVSAFHRRGDLCSEKLRNLSQVTQFRSRVARISEKAVVPHSSTLAWKIPWMEDPGGPQSVGSLRVGHDWATSLSLFTFMHWRRKWQPTPVFLPGEYQEWGSNFIYLIFVALTYK